MWITGHVVDMHGRGLPGVSIEASRPVAFRRVAVSDLQGHYVMRDLHPGLYTITFARSGFSSERRQSIELSPFVATVNARLRTDTAPEAAAG
jgi:hypothetical protein